MIYLHSIKHCTWYVIYGIINIAAVNALVPYGTKALTTTMLVMYNILFYKVKS